MGQCGTGDEGTPVKSDILCNKSYRQSEVGGSEVSQSEVENGNTKSKMALFVNVGVDESPKTLEAQNVQFAAGYLPFSEHRAAHQL